MTEFKFQTKSNKLKTISVHLTEKQAEELKQFTEMNQCTISAFFRGLFDAYKKAQAEKIEIEEQDFGGK